MLLEVCAFNIQSALLAAKHGAARVELCDNPADGGTTPSYGTIRNTRERIDIDLYPIIRPRGGDYLYSEDEMEIIKQDILLCRQLGCDGISVGVQQADGSLDRDSMLRIAEWAYPLELTCNRVFDSVPDPLAAIDLLVSIGCQRILTSGQAQSAPEGAALLGQLVREAGDRIIIMPGAGVRASNIATLIRETGAQEYHSSARIMADRTGIHRNSRISDMHDWYIADENELEAMVRQLEEAALQDTTS